MVLLRRQSCGKVVVKKFEIVMNALPRCSCISWPTASKLLTLGDLLLGSRQLSINVHDGRFGRNFVSFEDFATLTWRRVARPSQRRCS